MIKQLRRALSNLRPEEVRQTADRQLAIGLVSTSTAGYNEMENFLAPRDMTRERRAEVLSLLHRAGDPGIPARFDLVLYEHQLPRAENAFTFYGHDPVRTVKEILAQRGELGLPLARHFSPFRRPVVNEVMFSVSKENALFSLATALPNIVPNLVELPWAIGEFASDTAFLTMNQIRMGFLIAAASDSEIGYRAQKAEIVSIITGAFGFRAIARELEPSEPRPPPRVRPREGGGSDRNQLCQRNSCALRCEPWLSLTLTSAGPLKFIASSSAPRRSFGSST